MAKLPKKPKARKMPKRPRASASAAVWDNWKRRCDEVCKDNARRQREYKSKVSQVKKDEARKKKLMNYKPKACAI